MALNTDFMIAPSLQEYFVDKDTGLPLRAGMVYSFADQARTTPKPIYQLTGSAPNYTYSELPNPTPLTMNGTFSDGNNNDILPYYYPFDDEGNVELYYLTVYSSTGVFQFSRQGYPNIGGGGTSISALDNYVPNGQFLFNYMQNAHDNLVQGQIQTNSTGITEIAQGGWSFERNPSSTATDIVTFTSEGIQDPSLPALPRWVLNVETTLIGTNNTFKDVRIKFGDVNTFASDSQKYTFGFSGIDKNGGNTQVSLVLIKNFGTGGSAPTSTTLKTFNLTSSWDNYVFPFPFGTNGAFTIGDQNDDFVQIALRLPVSNLLNVSFTDMMLVQGEFSKAEMVFPETTNSQFSYQSLTIPPLASDGSDLYLPVVTTPTGLGVNSDTVGDVVQESQVSVYVNSLHPTTNRMLADGSQYETAGYSPLGIPYARLQAKYYDSTLNTPQWGTGRQYFTGIIQGSGIELRVTNNTGGLVTDAANGSVSPGFSIITDHTGATTYAVRSFYIDSNIFTFENTGLGAVTPASPGTSGFIISNEEASSESVWRVTVETVDGPGLANGTNPGKYFTFESNLAYYVWFQVDGTETDPAVPGHTGILIKLRLDYDAPMVANVVREALNGWQITAIRAVAASAIPTGSFFNINATDGTNQIAYYVWYKKDGVGTDPAPVGRTGIEVDIVTADTAVQVNLKTQIQINMKYFAAPDLRDAFIRGLGSGNPWITDWGARLAVVPGFQNGDAATYEFDTFRQHNHAPDVGDSFVADNVGAGTDDLVTPGTDLSSAQIAYSGFSETRPVNINLNFAIIY